MQEEVEKPVAEHDPAGHGIYAPFSAACPAPPPPPPPPPPVDFMKSVIMGF